MKSDICTQLRERGENTAADYIERLGKRFVDEERRADRYEEALKMIACDRKNGDPCICADESVCSYGIARAALGGNIKA